MNLHEELVDAFRINNNINILPKRFETEKIKNVKPHPASFLGYLLAHKSHHRGQIILSFKQSGHAVDKKTQFELWEW